MRRTTTILLITFIFISLFTFGQQKTVSFSADSVQYRINYLKKIFWEDDDWIVSDSSLIKNIDNLFYFIQKEPVDSIRKKIGVAFEENQQPVTRFPSAVKDSLEIPGFMPAQVVKQKKAAIRKSITESFLNKEKEIPVNALNKIDSLVNLVPPGEGMKLISDSVYSLPDSLRFLDAIPDSMVQTADDFQRILKLDSLRDAIVENFRIRYNDSLKTVYIDSVLINYQNKALERQLNRRIKRFTDSVNVNNLTVLKEYNDSIVKMVNDSVRYLINGLMQYANSLDTVRIGFYNQHNQNNSLTLSDRQQNYARFWLKNKQNDSVSILISNLNKRNVQMVIDDNVTITRMSQKEAKNFSLGGMKPMPNLQNIKEKYKKITPWNIGGDGTIGFTQTYLSNWKKGGKSALSMLLVLKGFANYSAFDNKIKWENSAEIRNGWLKPGGTDEDGEPYESEKNDDKFEIISRFGVSAFKKWYYSAEVDFQTQFFRGYKYPTSENPEPISAFMAPAKTLFKIGLDYKPNSNLSIFLSPFTSKTVFIRDTVLINKSNYNIPEGKRKLWVPGLNADIKFKTDITPDISYETKYKMFIDYTAPFEKFDIDWENLVVMKVNDYINMRFMLHLLYDDDVLFPVKDADGNELYKKPKLQVKELITVGFSYKINKKVYKARKVN